MATTTTTRKGRKTVSAATMGRARRSLTITLGVGIPLFSLYTSHRAGELYGQSAYVCGTMFLVICCTVLALSLSHLASAIGDITHSSRRDSWLIAIGLDCAIVAVELTQAAGHTGGLLATAFLVGITSVSMLLNCWAFLNHKPAKRGR